MFWGLTEFHLDPTESNSDSVSAEEEVESKHLKEAMREAGLLPLPGLSTRRPRSRNVLARPVQSPAGFLPHTLPVADRQQSQKSWFWKLNEVHVWSSTDIRADI